MQKKIHLNQKDNYTQNFGIAFRSSTIFYYKKSANFTTTINYMNYWPIKKSMDVMIVASLRSMSGKLLSREQVPFEGGHVVNYSPEIDEENFEGSLEMEAFAAGNLGIPFIAMIVVYDAEDSISMVHGYTRTYSTHEVEEGRTISAGEEAGLVSRDTNTIRSFIICHNGIYAQEPQTAQMWMTNHQHETHEVKVEIPQLSPYETYKLYPNECFPDLVAFLDGEPGNCAISFNLNGGFTRTVVGNETTDEKEFQVYHSNFNYGRHDPGYVEKEPGYFSFPISSQHDRQIVHMDSFSAPGKYKVYSNNNVYDFEPGMRIDIPMSSEVMRVERLDGNLPARLNLVLSSYLKDSKVQLPMESARGFYHSKRPPKYRLWMIAAIGRKYRSKLIIHSITDIYGPVGDSILEVKLYRENSMEVTTKTFNAEEIIQFQDGIYVDELFSEQSNQHENEIGQLWVQASSFGGHQAFTTIEKENGSASIEHNY